MDDPDIIEGNTLYAVNLAILRAAHQMAVDARIEELMGFGFQKYHILALLHHTDLDLQALAHHPDCIARFSPDDLFKDLPQFLDSGATQEDLDEYVRRWMYTGPILHS